MSESSFGKQLNIAGFVYPTLVNLSVDKNQEVHLGEGGFHFQGTSNSSIYVITVSSPNEIGIENISCKLNLSIEGEQLTAGGNFHFCYFTDGTDLNLLRGTVVSEEYVEEGHLRYFQYKLGQLNYTYENRSVFNWSGWFAGFRWNYGYNFSLAPGTWHFIFTAGLFDISQKNTQVNMSVWMNFSDFCDDVDISTSEGGTINALWYGEFNSNLLVSKVDRFELMINGKTSFHINNTFIYDFLFGI